MDIKREFLRTLEAVETVLKGEHASPRDVRDDIKRLSRAYEAQPAIMQAYHAFEDSGVPQMRALLRAANVKEGEPMADYLSRLRTNLDEMRLLDLDFRVPSKARPAAAV